MPHRLMQAVWQAQQALAQVQQMAEQLLREQEIRNNWYMHPINQPNQPYYGMPNSPINQNWPQNQYPPMSGVMYPPNDVGTYVEPIFEEEQNFAQNVDQKSIQPKPKTSRKLNQNE